jgi:hypothetical protein
MTMLKLSTPSLFGEESLFLVEGSLVKTYQPPTEPERVLTVSDLDSIEKLSESQTSVDLIGFCLRMFISLSIEDLIGFLPTWTQQVTPGGRSYYQAQQPEQPINGSVCGWLHTPTRTANLLASSMMKHQCCRNLRDTYGDTLEPWMFEDMMGFPQGWTSLGEDDCKH